MLFLGFFAFVAPIQTALFYSYTTSKSHAYLNVSESKNKTSKRITRELCERWCVLKATSPAARQRPLWPRLHIFKQKRCSEYIYSIQQCGLPGQKWWLGIKKDDVNLRLSDVISFPGCNCVRRRKAMEDRGLRQTRAAQPKLSAVYVFVSFTAQLSDGWLV